MAFAVNGKKKGCINDSLFIEIMVFIAL